MLLSQKYSLQNLTHRETNMVPKIQQTKSYQQRNNPGACCCYQIKFITYWYGLSKQKKIDYFFVAWYVEFKIFFMNFDFKP